MPQQHERQDREPIALTGMLAEFRDALEAEMKAARSHAATNAVSLVNGRRIAQVGGGYQYVFDIENALNLPGDAPGDLHVPGRSRLEVTIISIDGTAITLSVPEQLGSVVPSAKLQSDLSQLMRRLIERIEALAERPNPTGDRVLGLEPASGSPQHVARDDQQLNAEQVKAVASSLGRDTTFIWGPPGTGKTSTIGAIGEALCRNGRSVLLVSHTNAAVDQALWHIGETVDPAELASGRVIRVGDPKDQRLLQEPDLLLGTHVAHRSEELTRHREELGDERTKQVKEAQRLSRLIDLCEWVTEADRDLETMSDELQEIQDIEAKLVQVRAEQSELSAQADHWTTAARAAQHAVRQETDLAELDQRNEDIRQRQALCESKLVSARDGLAHSEKLLGSAQAVAPLRFRAGQLPSPVDQTEHVKSATGLAARTAERRENLAARLSEAEAVHNESTSVGRLTRMWRRLPPPEKQIELVDHLKADLGKATQQTTRADQALEKEEHVLSEVEELHRELRLAADVPQADEQAKAVDKQRGVVEAVHRRLGKVCRTLEAGMAKRAGLSEAIERFRCDYILGPQEVLAEAEAREARLAEVKSHGDELVRQCAPRRDSLAQLLRGRLRALKDWGLAQETDETAESMLVAIRDAHSRAVSETESMDLDELRRGRADVNERIKAIEHTIREIDEALKKVEELVIADATVVATTLTRAYLRDSIQSRRFDTVILDEASMAPIPALWVAASLADHNGVVVGDFKQLPPIVLSDNELAQKWLGRDVFEVAGMMSPVGAPEHFVALREQFRMHPEISAIPNVLFYDNELRDARGTDCDSSLTCWYRHDWGFDCPVLLVDMEPVHAWVTSVPRGRRRSSRLNFLSATVCVDIAETLLRADRERLEPGERPRVLITCPYRPHAQLLEMLLREHDLTGDVLAGTTHSFQGSEADVVILDLVNDEPHWRVGMFNPNFDDRIRRLLNVALTRAKRRLIVLGDFKYIGKQAKKAFLGATLLPFLQSRYRCESALDIAPAGLSARAARAQSKVFGGEIEPDADRLTVTQEHFYPMLQGDISRAESRLVIFSPFITEARLAMLEPHLRAAVERGVRVFVVTKTRDEHDAGYRFVEEALRTWGAVVIHKKGMHEKLVFVDDRVIWSGSLNPLSFRDTQEIMTRWDSPRVFKEFATTLRLHDLLAEYGEGPPSCPICGCEVVASEGNRAPFYWRCVADHCYRRRIDQPPIAKDGIVRCLNCGGDVIYGTWGDKRVWRCVENKRHRQPIAWTDLHLPKMRALIPKRELNKLQSAFQRVRSARNAGCTEAQQEFDFGS